MTFLTIFHSKANVRIKKNASLLNVDECQCLQFVYGLYEASFI
jgi:hypothetical protein